VVVEGRRGEKSEITEDEDLGRFEEKRVYSLKPVFAADGTITAANASSLSDGARFANIALFCADMV
jgi:acetyl-CoA C-acetyltransferase